MDELAIREHAAQEPGSTLALAGLMLGVGVLDPVEVLRYLDSTFRDYAQEKGSSE